MADANNGNWQTAHRSAESVQAWHAQHGARGLRLTGTDLYRNIGHDVPARQSLALAKSLVMLHALGAHALLVEHRAKTRVIVQSTSTRQTLPKTPRHLRVVMVGHLREENDPVTLMAHLGHRCALRAPLFEPQAERAALHCWVRDLWTP